MTLATVAAPNGNGLAVLFVMVILIGFITVVVLWMHERMWDAHDRELAANAEQHARLDYRLDSLLEFLGVEVPEPIEDDSPAALSAQDALAMLSVGEARIPEYTADDSDLLVDDDTDEFPAIPATEPSGIPIQVHGALIEARDLSGEFPHPVDSDDAKARNAAWVEEQLLEIRARINAAQEAS